MADDKDVVFTGSSLTDLRAFPETARRDAGYQIDRVQRRHPGRLLISPNGDIRH